MPTIFKQKIYWLNIGLVLALLMGLLPPAGLAAASTPENRAEGVSQSNPRPPFLRNATEVAPPQFETRPAGDLSARTFALPFDFGRSTGTENPRHRVETLVETLHATSLQATSLQAAENPVDFSDLNRLPLSFAPNAGQWAAPIRFQAFGMLGSRLFFAPQEVILALPAVGSATGRPTDATLRIRFEGANPAPEVTGDAPLPGIVNYFSGNDPGRWQTNLPTYKNLVYRNLYPGIDLVYNGAESALKGTYLVAPGADPTQIRWRYSGAKQTRLDEASGDLVITSSANPETPIIERAPLVWQEVEGRQVSVAAYYTLSQAGVIGLDLGDYDPALPLTIDPVLDFSTYLGGDSSDSGTGIVVDDAGNIYVTGSTNSSNFYYEPGSYPQSGTDYNVFVVKIGATGNYSYSTYLGGSGEEAGNSIAVDKQGNVYVTGYTGSWNDFPTTSGALKTASSNDCLGSEGAVPCQDAFLLKLNATGSDLLYSTYLGGDKHDIGHDITLDGNNNIYLVGETKPDDSYDPPLVTLNFPTVKAVQPTWGGGADAFVTQIISAGGVYTYGYSTYLGGSSYDYGYSIAVDNSGRVYVTGQTSSANFPTRNALQPANQGSSDVFVTQIISASGVYTYGYSTYLGGGSTDEGRGVAVDGNSNVYVTGFTLSSNFPTQNAFQPSNQKWDADAFVTKIISASGVYTYGYSTYLGGASVDSGYSVAVDTAGDAYITGETWSSDFPTTSNALMPYTGQYDVFVTKIISAGGVYTYSYSTYLGGGYSDYGRDIAVSSNGSSVYVTGETGHDFPTTPSAPQPSPGDSLSNITDAFVSRLVWPSDLTLNFNGSAPTAQVGQKARYQVTIGNDSETAATGLVLTHTLPAAIVFEQASLTPTQVLSPTGAGQRLVWNLPPLAGSSLTTLVITGAVSLSTPVSSTLTTTATVSSNLAETNLTNNTVSFSSLVQPGPVHHLTLTTPLTTGLLAPFSATVSARDIAGNVATGYTGTIVLSGTGRLAWNGYYDIEDTTFIEQTLTPSNHGQVTFYRLKFKPVGRQVMTATAGALTATVSITVDNRLVVIDDYTVWDEAEVTVGDLVIPAGKTLFLKGSTLVTAANITIAGYISADEARDQSGPGPGAGQNGLSSTDVAGGGGYGGPGAGPNNRGGPTYGSETYPTEQGSNGGNIPEYLPGLGGGAIHLAVSSTLILSGSISAGGGYGDGAGAGSGGSILLEAGQFAGNGSLTANGGESDSSNSGGGGRIAVYADRYSFSGTMAANGGTGHEQAGRGTIYLSYVDLNRSGLVVSPTTLAADGLATALATVTLKTGNDTPVAGRPVKLAVTPADGIFINGQPAAGGVTLSPTNTNGAATARITSTVSGVKQVAASTGNGAPISRTVTITFEQGIVDPNRSLVVFDNDQDTAAADGLDSLTVRITARDVLSNPVAGVTVVLTSTAPISISQPPATGPNGQTTGLITSTRVGTASIRALIGGAIVGSPLTATFRGTDPAVHQTGPAQIAPGQAIIYNLTVENRGLLPATGVIVTDTLPAGVSYVGHSAAVTTAVSGPTVIWNFGTLDGGASRSFALFGRVATHTVSPGQLLSNNVALISLTADEDGRNNSHTFTSTVIAPYSHTLTLEPETTTLSVGATGQARLDLSNIGPLADVYTLTVTGLTLDQYTPITAGFPLDPGTLRRVSLDLHAPDCAPGTRPFTITAYSRQSGQAVAVRGNLIAQANPHQFELTPADNSATGARSVLFSWRTDAPTTGLLTLSPGVSPTQTITRTTPLSTYHTVLVSGLARNTNYTWTAQSNSACGQTTGSPQTFTVGNGVVFAERDITQVIAHDYDQRITMTLKNEDMSLAHTLRVSVSHPYNDLIVGFVGRGSVDDGNNYLVLDPGQSGQVILAAHAQDAVQTFYDLTVRAIADEGSDEEIIDYAHLKLDARQANNFSLSLVDSNPTTLVDTYRVTNHGLPITDLGLQAIDPQTGLPAQALIQPTLDHARLGLNQSIDFEVIPLFTPEDAINLPTLAYRGRSSGLAHPLLAAGQGIDVEVVANAGGATQTMSQTMGCAMPNQLYAVAQRNVRLQFRNGDWYCTNRPNITLNLVTPGSIEPADVLGANLASRFTPNSDVKPHNMQLSFNSTQLAGFYNTVPQGDYLFPLDPVDLKTGGNVAGVVNQVIGITSQHLNGGHYIVANGNRLDLVLDHYTCYVCAPDAEQARSLGCRGVTPNPTRLDIQITHPVSGTNAQLGRPITLTAQVYDYLAEQIPYPVEAKITYRDIISGGAPAQESLILPYRETASGSDWDAYQVAWTPAYTGDVSITAIVDATTIKDSDTVDLASRAEPTDLQVEISQPIVPSTYGSPVTVEAVVTNRGGAVTDSFDVVFKYYKPANAPTDSSAFATWIPEKGALVGENTQTITELGANQSQTVTGTFTPSTEDTNTWFIIEVEVDPDSN